MNTPSKRDRDFYSSSRFAVMGMSGKKRNFAWGIYDGLVRAGLRAFPVNPSGGNSRGVEFFRSCAEIPGSVDAAVLCFDARKSSGALAELKESGVKKIWFQQGSFDKSLLEEADRLGFEYYTGCIMMYMPETAFFHKVHRFLHELFTKGPN